MEESQFLNALKPYYEAFAETDQRKRLELLRIAMMEDAEIGAQSACSLAMSRSRRRSRAFTNGPGAGWSLPQARTSSCNSARIGGAIVGAERRAYAQRATRLSSRRRIGRIQRVIPFFGMRDPRLPTAWPRAPRGTFGATARARRTVTPRLEPDPLRRAAHVER